MMEDLAVPEAAERKIIMIDATYLKADRTASSPRVKERLGALIGRTKGGMNTKLHAVTDANGRPISFFITAGQVSDYTGAAALLDELPKAKWLLGDRGHDADGCRDASQANGSSPAFRVGNHATKPSNTTNAAANGATGSRSCSGVSKTGGVILRATIDAQWSSSRPSLSLQALSSGSDHESAA